MYYHVYWYQKNNFLIMIKDLPFVTWVLALPIFSLSLVSRLISLSTANITKQLNLRYKNLKNIKL